MKINDENNMIRDNLTFKHMEIDDQRTHIMYLFDGDDEEKVDSRFFIEIFEVEGGGAEILFRIHDKKVTMEVCNDVMMKDNLIIVPNASFCTELYNYFKSCHVHDLPLYQTTNEIKSNQVAESFIKVQKHNHHEFSKGQKMRLDGYIFSQIKYQNGMISVFYKEIISAYKKQAKKIRMPYMTIYTKIFCDFAHIL